MFVAWDTTTPDQIPNDAHVILPYNCGEYEWAHKAHEYFPHAIIQEVSVDHQVPGHFLDIEAGAATPAQYAAWHQLSLDHRFWRPGPYGSRDTLDTITLHEAVAHIPRQYQRLWIADPTGLPHIPTGYDGCQWLWRAMGRNLDESLFRQDAMPAPIERPAVWWTAEIAVELGHGGWKIRGLPVIKGADPFA